MKALDLYKFYTKNALEYHWFENSDGDDVMLFVDTYCIQDFMNLLRADKKEDGFECRMKGGYLAFRMKDICDYFDIEITEVFPR
jgi:hypothetical protein